VVSVHLSVSPVTAVEEQLRYSLLAGKWAAAWCSAANVGGVMFTAKDCS